MVKLTDIITSVETAYYIFRSCIQQSDEAHRLASALKNKFSLYRITFYPFIFSYQFSLLNIFPISSLPNTL